MASEIIRLKSTESGYCYTTKKNKKNTPDKFEMLKYDPIVKKRVLFKEAKLK